MTLIPTTEPPRTLRSGPGNGPRSPEEAAGGDGALAAFLAAMGQMSGSAPAAGPDSAPRTIQEDTAPNTVATGAAPQAGPMLRTPEDGMRSAAGAPATSGDATVLAADTAPEPAPATKAAATEAAQGDAAAAESPSHAGDGRAGREPAPRDSPGGDGAAPDPRATTRGGAAASPTAHREPGSGSAPHDLAPQAMEADVPAGEAPAAGTQSLATGRTNAAGAAAARSETTIADTGRDATPAVDHSPGVGDSAADAGIAADAVPGPRAADRPHPATPAASQLPAGFGHRLAEAVTAFPDRSVELVLSPEELGRVRMTLTTQDGALTLAIRADRAETADLMRRHIDQLAQDFRDLGFTDLSFSFGRGDTAPGAGRASPPAGAQPSAPDSAPAPLPAVTGSAPSRESDGGLDLRL